MLNGIRRFFAVLIGLVLLAGGLLKLNDPVGTGLIVTEYLKWMHLGFLQGGANVLGAALGLLESLLGTALLTGIWRRAVAIAASALLGFFTLVTIGLLISNPSMDCGCFGEAIHLTHLQSFLKNIVLLAFAAVAFIPYRNLGETPKRKYVSSGLVAVSLVAVLWLSWRHLPSVDFTAYKPNSELSASEDNDYQAMDGYQAYYIYQKGSQTGSFTLDRLPDSTWTFVRVDTLLRSPFPMEEDVVMLPFTDASGQYQDEQAVLGKVLLVSVYRPQKLSARRTERIRRLVQDAGEAGFSPLVLAAGTPADFAGSGFEDKVYTADYKTLITLNRSNGGAVWIDDGSIIRKWSSADLPSAKVLGRYARLDPLDQTVKYLTRGRIRAQGYLLTVLAILIFI